MLENFLAYFAGRKFILLASLLTVSAAAVLFFYLLTRPTNTVILGPPYQTEQGKGAEEWKTYRNDEHGFEVRYPPTAPFGESFAVQLTPSNYYCVEIGKGGDRSEYKTTFPRPGDECRLAIETFEEYARGYDTDPQIIEIRFLKTADGTPAYLIYKKIDIHNVTTGQDEKSDFYYILLELRKEKIGNDRAIRLDLRSTLICPDGICQIGETPASCPADCRGGRDFGLLFEQIFATFKYL